MLTGYIPYTKWECLSPACFNLLNNHTGENHTFYTRDIMCSNKFKADIDFTWTPKRSSFAVNFGIYCGAEAQKSSINSFYFIGAFAGLCGSSSLFEMFGRKKVTLAAGVIAIGATLGMAFAQNIQTLLGLRVMQGLGVLVAMTGRYIWCMEFTPLRLRNISNALLSITWPLGTCTLILICYLVFNWKYAVGIVSIIGLLCYIPLIFCPESPRYFAFHRKEKEALEILNKMARFYKNPPLPAESLEMEQTSKKQNILKQLKDFFVFPAMLRRTLFLMLCWFVVSLFYYGLSFGWHKMGKNIFASQGFACLSEVVAVTVSLALISQAGRKKTMMMVFLGIGIFFGISIVDDKISSTWTVQQIGCLIVIIFIAAGFSTIYLYTAELSPTSHRGLIMSLCSGTARVGSFIGPYIVHLYDYLDRKVVMGIFGGVGILGALGTFFLLEDSTGVDIPETPSDIQGTKQLEEEDEEDPE